MPLFDCKINLILTSSENCVICSTIRKTKFAIADTKLYVTIYITNCTQNIIFQK